ncbi:MAG: four helix bundle protein [Anaerolineales bacterium]|jgi:four helix bundle protein|nr:four helix bundle protein [Anaerolineales bacterium]
MTVMNLDKLEVWARGKDFALAVYKEVVPHLPVDEKWNLISQLKRAAQSIPANIAEGHGRFHFLDNVRFCYYARGSLTEVQSHISLAYELGYLPKEIYERMTTYAESLGKQLNNYIAYLKRSKHGEKEFPAGYTLREESEPYTIEEFPDNTQPH